MNELTNHDLKFQSTPPVKAATRQICVIACDLGISIHAAREGGDYGKGDKNMTKFISIHAAREGGDDKPDTKDKLGGISIHAAREGGDVMLERCPSFGTYFNPRRP